jgi:hypothetical protein
MRAWPGIAGLVLLAANFGGAVAAPPGEMIEVTDDTYRLHKDTHGVVVVSVEWGRRWNFCGFENVQMRTFAFDRVPVQKRSDKDAADLVLDPPPSLLAGPGTTGHHALLVEPGEYALTYTELKLARSVNKVDSYSIGRKRLIADGTSRAGSFTIAAGETVYIGHFSTECIDGEPRIWRYYIEGRAAFKEYLTTRVTTKYPFLDADSVQYRLFKTSEIGNDYELQCKFPPSDQNAESDGVTYDGEDCVAN